MSVLMRRENTLIIEPGSDISKIQIINFILLPNSKKHFEGPPLQKSIQIITCNIKPQIGSRQYRSQSSSCIIVCYNCVSWSSHELQPQNIVQQQFVIINLTLIQESETIQNYQVSKLSSCPLQNWRENPTFWLENYQILVIVHFNVIK
ncbi:Hypothetical_protein [Hexamita inflata]|uniref:Hypothetical_protein n=1 Tax=Hexamita inflata TaxID=28002 RepID=A0ABP1HAW0_9EUKA